MARSNSLHPKVAALQYSPGSATGSWFHPIMNLKGSGTTVTREDLRNLAYHYFDRFLPFFTNQPEGSICPKIDIDFTLRMRQRLGLAYLFEHKLRLNQSYFAEDPRLLPYTLFHELTHLWLYDCLLDPGHTQRFYKKMKDFEATGLPIDKEVHIHTRLAPEGQYVYSCPNCQNRWYLRDKLKQAIFCGYCFDRDGVEHYAQALKTKKHPELTDPQSDTAA